MPAIAAAHNIPYVAPATHSSPFDLMEKVRRAVNTPGPAYVHVLSVCPTGWRSATDTIIRQGRLAVQTGVFPLYEVINGEYKMSLDIPKLRPVQDYLKIQGRFRHLSDDIIKEIQERVTRDYKNLVEKAKNGTRRTKGKSQRSS
jgi:pyruvate ferredoxin oxidoreductase beta subunit